MWGQGGKSAFYVMVFSNETEINTEIKMRVNLLNTCLQFQGSIHEPWLQLHQCSSLIKNLHFMCKYFFPQSDYSEETKMLEDKYICSNLNKGYKGLINVDYL